MTWRWLGPFVLCTAQLVAAQTPNSTAAPATNSPPKAGSAPEAPPTAAAKIGVQERVLMAVRTAYSKNERPLVVFDLDGTLFDNRPRTLQILHEFAEQELKQVRPEAARKLLALSAPQIQYMLTDTLKNQEISEEAVINNAAVFWSQRFFTDEYLGHDTPVAGVVSFVRSLYSAGARIVYLSARDVPRQLLGSVRALRDRGFPVGIQGTEIMLKPTLQTPDAVFKQQVTNYLRQAGKVIAAFDNEPTNVNVYRRAFSDAMVVLFNAPHTPNAPTPLPNIETLDKFEP